MPKHGLMSSRGISYVTMSKPEQRNAAIVAGINSSIDQKVPVGHFGRMFEGLPAFNPSNDAVHMLSETMREQDPVGNSPIPLAFVFLGQFIDHDVTFDPVTRFDERLDPHAIRNFRSPVLDLDNVYGDGPDASRHLYDTQGEDMSAEHRLPIRLLTGSVENSQDLPRNMQGTAIIGDPRNDENLLLSQFHAAFLRFHNQVVQRLKNESGGNPPDNKRLFEMARQQVTNHYHYIVVKEFLPHLCGQGVVDKILMHGRQFFKWEDNSDKPFIPVEFSGAAYRMGHTLIREKYALSSSYPADKSVNLFSLPFFGLQKQNPLDDKELHKPALSGYNQDYNLDFSFFVETDSLENLQFCRPVDAKISTQLFDLPFILKSQDPPSSLPERNMRRGRTLKLPGGQILAEAIGAPHVLSNDDLGIGSIIELDGMAPLWFYILKESELTQNGDRLGFVGATIVAETILGMIEPVQKNYKSDFVWDDLVPTLNGRDDFTFADLLTFQA